MLKVIVNRAALVAPTIWTWTDAPLQSPHYYAEGIHLGLLPEKGSTFAAAEPIRLSRRIGLKAVLQNETVAKHVVASAIRWTYSDPGIKQELLAVWHWHVR